jgi:hypothetical protein
MSHKVFYYPDEEEYYCKDCNERLIRKPLTSDEEWRLRLTEFYRKHTYRELITVVRYNG